MAFFQNDCSSGVQKEGVENIGNMRMEMAGAHGSEKNESDGAILERGWVGGPPIGMCLGLGTHPNGGNSLLLKFGGSNSKNVLLRTEIWME